MRTEAARSILLGVDAHSRGGGLTPGAHQSARTRSHAARRRTPEFGAAAASAQVDRNRRVLVVEDERTIRQSIAGYLGDAGYTVDEAGNGTEALARMEAAIPDVVVLDLLMPVMGGRDFMQACREQPRLAAVPVILLSAAHDLTQATEQLQPRASLAKPIDLDVLLAIVDRVANS
jgi:CheY-like chemotaxis protein